MNQTHDSSQTYWIIHWFLGPRTLISPIITKSDLLDHLLDHLFYITSYFWAGFPISEVPKCGHPLQLCFWMACSLSSLAKPGSQNAGMKRLPIAIPSIPSPHHSGGGSTVIFFNGVSLSKHLTNRPACGHPRLRHTHHVTSWELTITAWEDGLPGNLPLLCRPPPQLPISTLLGEVDWTHLASPTQVPLLQKQLQKKMDFSIQVFFCGSIWPLPKATVGSQYSQALHENRLVVRPPSVAGRFPAEGVKGGTWWVCDGMRMIFPTQYPDNDTDDHNMIIIHSDDI